MSSIFLPKPLHIFPQLCRSAFFIKVNINVLHWWLIVHYFATHGSGMGDVSWKIVCSDANWNVCAGGKGLENIVHLYSDNSWLERWVTSPELLLVGVTHTDKLMCLCEKKKTSAGGYHSSQYPWSPPGPGPCQAANSLGNRQIETRAGLFACPDDTDQLTSQYFASNHSTSLLSTKTHSENIFDVEVWETRRERGPKRRIHGWCKEISGSENPQETQQEPT